MGQDKILVRLDEEIKKQFKAACAIDDVTMEGQITELIKVFLEKRETKKAKK